MLQSLKEQNKRRDMLKLLELSMEMSIFVSQFRINLEYVFSDTLIFFFRWPTA